MISSTSLVNISSSSCQIERSFIPLTDSLLCRKGTNRFREDKNEKYSKFNYFWKGWVGPFGSNSIYGNYLFLVKAIGYSIFEIGILKCIIYVKQILIY